MTESDQTADTHDHIKEVADRITERDNRIIKWMIGVTCIVAVLILGGLWLATNIITRLILTL